MGLFKTVRRGVTLSSVGLAAAAAVLTARHYLETPQPLESALDGDGRIDRKHGGDIYYNIAGPRDAQPVVLLHDFYPGASNFEYRRLYPRLAERYRVYAPDWLGFGMSEHPNVAYTGEFYATMLNGFLADVVERPAIVVAHGHAANIAVRAASDTPELVERLVLVAPDVFAGLRSDPTPSQALTRATQRALLGVVPYALLSSKPALRWMTFNRAGQLQDTAASEERVEHLYASAHQFGGQHALLAFLTGELDLPMQNAFALLEPPVLILAGERDRRRPRVDLEDVAVLNPHAELEVIPGAGDPIYEDRPEPVINALNTWLAAPRDRHAPDDALLYPLGDEAGTLPEPDQGEPTELSEQEPATSLGAGGIEHADDDVTPIVLPTAGVTEPQAMQMMDETAMTTPDEPLTGTPGSVTPGVSDMGLEGLSTPDAGGVATLDDEGVRLGPPSAPTDQAVKSQPDDGVSALLPEAGDVAPSHEDEQAARAGVEPPVAPATNIGYADSRGTSDERPPRGDVAGVAQIVPTPDQGVATPESAVQTPAETVDTAEMMGSEQDITGDTETTPARKRGPSRSTRGLPREAAPRRAPSGASGNAGTTRTSGASGTNRPNRASTGGASKSASSRGRQTDHQAGHHKRNRSTGGK